MFNNFLKSNAVGCFLLKKCIFWVLLALFPSCFIPAYASEFELQGITVSNPNLVDFGKNAKSGSGYFVISNKNSSAVILNKVTSDIGAAMLHKTDVDETGIAKMKHLENIKNIFKNYRKLSPGLNA